LTDEEASGRETGNLAGRAAAKRYAVIPAIGKLPGRRPDHDAGPARLQARTESSVIDGIAW